MSSVIRSVKNVTKGYSSVQVKVRNATSNDPWGPTGTDMADIAKITYNSSTDFYEVMDMLDKRLNDKGKNWRHVLKSLKVLDYCLHEGSELCVTWARKNIYIIKTLREFIYLDEDGKDVGANIRMSAKELTLLVMDEERLRAERANRHTWKSRVTGLEDMSGLENDGEASGSTPRRTRGDRSRRTEDEDLEYKLALEASKHEAEEDARRRAGKSGPAPVEDDDDLAKAIRLSKEEEELRRRELEEANANSLFDDTPSQAPQPTGFNQGYQQQAAVDWFGNPVEQQQQQQQPQTTGYLNNAYGQPTGMQPQQTGFQNGYGYGQYQQPQQTGYDQFQQQPQQQYMQPQQTGYNPWGNQMNGTEQQQIKPQATAAGSNNPWASATPQSPQSIAPQATGSNNPFASAINRQQHTPQRAPTLATLQEQKTAQFNQPSYNPITSFQAPVQQPLPQQHTAQPMDPHRAQLNALLSSGEGQDTFGNVGNTRIPAQHTAPGTFVNSAGQGFNKLDATRTGTNPFLHNQFTGMPQQQYPAQTGPAQGYGSPSPFGAQPQRQQGGQGGSLIDL